MTKEELEKTPMFRIVKRSLMRKYPFVKDVILEDDTDRYETLWFFDVIVDPQEINDQYNMGGVNDFAIKRYWWNKEQDYYTAVYLSLYFEDREKSRQLQNEIENDVRYVQKSDAVKDFKLPKVFAPSSFLTKLPPYQEQ